MDSGTTYETPSVESTVKVEALLTWGDKRWDGPGKKDRGNHS